MSTRKAGALLIVAAGPPGGGTVAALSPGDGRMHGQAAVAQPLHIVRHPRGGHIYAASAAGPGSIVALRLTAGGELHPVSEAPSEGATPCHLAIDPTGRFLLTANYDGGTVAVRALGQDGRLGPVTDVAELPPPRHPADPGRQDKAHPHQVVFDPAGSHLLVSDLGTDRVLAFRLDGHNGRLHQANVCALPAGSGPRNLTFLPGAPTEVYIACELDSTVKKNEYNPRTAALTPRHSTPAGQRRAVRNYPGVIAVSAAHHRVYVANRGNDTIATVAPAGLTETPSGGSWPMDIAATGTALLVANRDTGNIATLELDPVTGAPARHTGDIAIPRPVSILLAPPAHPHTA
ncbi:MAG TPA: beta-propeller fold lactonase family protein [Streptosporangiaceae bacterium]|nr:beta-propeller fold lactonase family protein [Streptosporangiaceae bacterium]